MVDNKLNSRQWFSLIFIFILLFFTIVILIDFFYSPEKQEIKVTETNISNEIYLSSSDYLSSITIPENSPETLRIQSGPQPFIISMDRNDCSLIACECYKEDYSCTLLCYKCEGSITGEDLF